MGCYNPAYSAKLHRIVARSGIYLVCNPMVNLHLQGRFDGYPKRRGLTQVKEMLAAGVNVAFGHDDVMDPWYPLGTANPLQVALVGAHATQLTSPDEVAECFRDGHRPGRRRAGAGRGVRRRRSAGPRRSSSRAADRFDVVRRQVRPTHVVAKGRVVARGPEHASTLTWPGTGETRVDFRREADR